MTRAELLLRFAGLTAIAAAVVFIAGAGAIGAWRMYQKLAQASDDEQAARKQLALLQAQEVQLKSDVADLETERGVEGALRERYGVARPGEGIIQVVEEQATTSGAAASSTPNFFVRLFQALTPW